MHGTFSHFGRPRPAQNVLTEASMFYALNELHAGQPVICGGKPTVVALVKGGLVWLAGFANPVKASQIEAC